MPFTTLSRLSSNDEEEEEEAAPNIQQTDGRADGRPVGADGGAAAVMIRTTILK